MQKTFYYQYRIALFFFVISAIYGWSLRLYKLVDYINIPYHSILQAHSHVTFLGWGFLAVISLIGKYFFSREFNTSKYLKNIFRVMSLTLLGMLISFPWQGYKLFSIIFLSSFLVASYFYLARILNVLKGDFTLSSRFIKTGIWYYYLSSIGIWAIAFIVSKYGKVDLYFNAIYFYLHFLYNGFFTFVLFGLLVRFIEQRTNSELKKSISSFYWLMNIACIPAYTLSILWREEPLIIVYVAFLSAFIQFVSLLFGFSFFSTFINLIKAKTNKRLAILIFISYSLKIIIQFLSSFPVIVKQAILFKSYFIIGYIHLYTLGFLSLFIMLLAGSFINVKKIGVMLFVFGVLLSEILLFSGGIILYVFKTVIDNFDLGLFIASSFLPLGIIVQFISLKNKKT